MVKIFFSGKRKKKRNDKRCTIPVTALLRKRRDMYIVRIFSYFNSWPEKPYNFVAASYRAVPL